MRQRTKTKKEPSGKANVIQTEKSPLEKGAAGEAGWGFPTKKVVSLGKPSVICFANATSLFKGGFLNS